MPVADSLESELSAAKDRPLLRRAHRREWQLLEDAVPTDRGRVGLADEGEDVEVLGDRVLVACDVSRARPISIYIPSIYTYG